MRKSIIWVGLVILILMVSNLACSIGGGEDPTPTPVPATDTPEPQEEPTEVVGADEADTTEETAEVEETTTTDETEQDEETAVPEATKPVTVSGGKIAAESQVHGVRLEYPEGWYYDDSIFIILSSAEDASPLESESMPDALVMFVMSGASEEFEMDDTTTDEPSEDMFDDMIDELGADSASMEILDGPREDTINGIPVQIMEFRGEEEGTEIHGKIVMYDNEEQAAIAIAISPEEVWGEYDDEVDDIFDSIELFEGTGFDFGLDGFDGMSETGQDRGRLSDGDLVGDEFVGGDAHAWTFTGSAGQYASAILTPLDDDMDVVLQLQSADGGFLAEADDGFNGEAEVIGDYLLDYDGDYLLVVDEFFDEAGGYTLELSLSDEPLGLALDGETQPMGMIMLDIPMQSMLEGPQDHAWILIASGGEIVNILVTPLDEDMDMAFSVLGPSGETVVDLYDYTFSDEAEELKGLVLDEAGPYTIIVEEYSGNAGSYTLAVETGEEGVANDESGDYEVIEMGTISYYGSEQVSIDEGEYVHEWFFEGQAGDVVTIIVAPMIADIDLQLALIAPDGEFLFDLDDMAEGGPEGIYGYELPSDGTYSIAIAEYWGAYAEYTLSLVK